MDLANWRKHINWVVKTEGQWMGIADENGYPLYELLGKLTFPEAHLTPSSAEATIQLTPGHPAIADLIGDNLGETDDEGRLTPIAGKTRLLLLERRGARRAATVTHVIVRGENAPTEATIHGVDLLDGLECWPAPSIPVEWERAEWVDLAKDESGVTYEKPRRLARLQFTTKLTLYREEGPAKTVIRNVIQDSFNAVNAAMEWTTPHAVVDYSGGEDTTPHVQIRINDDPVLATVSETARQCGLAITVSLWWPGDQPITVRTDQEGTTTTERTWNHPIQIVHVEEFKEG